MTTQYATASYQEIIDLHTESDKVSVVGIHTPNSDTPYHMLKGFWNQFRKFKYNGCSLSLVPAAQLPPDPLNVSYEAGEPTIDPRDMLNPILFHGCHGDDMGAILNTLYSEDTGTLGQMMSTLRSDSIDLNELSQASGNIPITEMYEALYYRALTDKTWLKAHPQRGFRKAGLHPMIYQVASTVQFGVSPDESDPAALPYATVHDPSDGSRDRGTHGVFGTSLSSNTVGESGAYTRPVFNTVTGGYRYSLPAARIGSFVTPRLQRLGWMDTRNVIGVINSLNGETSSSAPPSEENLASLFVEAQKRTAPCLCPKIFMGMIMLPPAYKCEQYFRLVLNHSFSFAKFRGASMQYDDIGSVKEAYSVFNFNDPEASKKKQDDEDEKHDPDATATE